MPTKQRIIFQQKFTEIFPPSSCDSQVTVGTGMKETWGSPQSLTLTCHRGSSPDPSSISALCVRLSLKQFWYWALETPSHFPAGCCNHQAEATLAWSLLNQCWPKWLGLKKWVGMLWCTAFVCLAAVVPFWDMFDPDWQSPVPVPGTPAGQISSTSLNQKLLGWQWSAG